MEFTPSFEFFICMRNRAFRTPLGNKCAAESSNIFKFTLLLHSGCSIDVSCVGRSGIDFICILSSFTLVNLVSFKLQTGCVVTEGAVTEETDDDDDDDDDDEEEEEEEEEDKAEVLSLGVFDLVSK